MRHTAWALRVHRTHTAYAPHVHRMCTACAPHMHRMCTACAPHVHRMCTAYAHHTACAPRVCTPHVHTQVLEFLGLSPGLLPAGPSQHCVVGKAGIMDEAPDAGKAVNSATGLVKNKAGTFGTGNTASKGLAIGDCTSDNEKRVDAQSKIKRYKMDPAAERALQRFFAPYNKKLIAVLGFDPGWSAGAEV